MKVTGATPTAVTLKNPGSASASAVRSALTIARSLVMWRTEVPNWVRQEVEKKSESEETLL